MGKIKRVLGIFIWIFILIGGQILLMMGFSEKGYEVRGNKITDLYGKEVIFRGLSRPSLEWNPQGEWGPDNLLSADDFQAMADWGANIVRLPLNQKYWLDQEIGNAYKQTVERVVYFATSSGMAVVLDLHWSDKGIVSGSSGQQRMPDKRSAQFWGQIARIYKSNRQVLFELYNEPHDISPQICMFGGDSGDGFRAVGMQELMKVIRAEGAKNIIIVNGCDNWGYSHAEAKRLEGENIVYGSHPYGQYPEKNSSDKFDLAFGFLKNEYPIMITEFGSTTETDCNTGRFNSMVVKYAEKNKMSWIAWAYGPWGCEFPSLLNSWNSNDRNPSGEIIYQALKKRQIEEHFDVIEPAWRNWAKLVDITISSGTKK